LKAVKKDDAEVCKYLWSFTLIPGSDDVKAGALTHLRLFALWWWKVHTRRDSLGWFFKHDGIPKSPLTKDNLLLNKVYTELARSLNSRQEAKRDWEAGKECITRCCNSSWWEWDGGSRPHHWRWNPCYCSTIRDGVPQWFR
jgi:hypothetical protein